MRNISKHPYLIICSLLLVFTGCKKQDYLIEQNQVTLTKQEVQSRYTNVPETANPILKQVATQIRLDDDKYNLLGKISLKLGFPVWNGSQVILNAAKHKNKNSNHTSATSTDTTLDYDIALIPLAQPSTETVDGFLACKITSDTVIIQCYSSRDYEQYGFGETEGELDAEEIAITTMVLEEKAFNHPSFQILDSRLFDLNNIIETEPSEVHILDNSTDVSSGTIVVVEYHHCTHTGQCAETGVCDQCNLCVSVEILVFNNFDYMDGGGGSGWGSGFSLGGNTGGSGWLPQTNAAFFTPTANSLDFVSINDVGIANNFKTVYAQLEAIYAAKPIDAYTHMSREAFINLIKSNPSIVTSIDPVTLLVKLGINGAADVLMQVLIIRMTDPSVTTWSQAFSKVDWVQVATTAFTGLLPWKDASSKFILAGINGSAAVISDLNNNGFQSWEHSGLVLIEGFCGSLLGNFAGDYLISKFGSISNFGQSLVAKFGDKFKYSTICKWLGGGIVNAAETVITSKGPITSIRKMIGFATGKVCVIGRKMTDRVMPYAQALGNNTAFFDESNPLAAPYFTQQVKNEWNTLTNNGTKTLTFKEAQHTLMYKANLQFIKDLKAQGYTFIDLGSDGLASNTSAFYEMELNEIFN